MNPYERVGGHCYQTPPRRRQFWRNGRALEWACLIANLALIASLVLFWVRGS